MTVFWKIYRKLFQNPVMANRGPRVILFALGLNLFFGTLFYFAEKNAQDGLTYLDSIWWAMVTMTTVGYGDFMAETFVGRFIISYPCMLLGIGIIGYLVGVVAENMLDRVSKKKRGLMQVKSKEHIIICNYPHLEKIVRLISELRRSFFYKKSPIVLLADTIQELPEELKKMEVQFVQGDPVREDILTKANITEAKGVFILANDPGNPKSDEKTFAIGTIIEMIEREIHRPIRTVVEMVSKENMKMMQRSRVDGIVSSDGIMDGLLVQEFLNPGVHDIVHQILTNSEGSQFFILETNLQGKQISELQIAMLQHETNLQLIGISRKGKNILSPREDMKIQENDRLVILAEHRKDFLAVEKDLLEK
jgi:voltage-gated potassium channel